MSDYLCRVPVGTLGQFVVGVNARSLAEVGRVIDGAQILTRSGQDGADSVLAETAINDGIDLWFERVVIGSDDGYFADLAAWLTAHDVRVTVVSRTGLLSWRLYVAVRDIQVLSLDGSGAKALFAVHVLAQLEADLRLSIMESFDLIAGASAGGVIALGLGAGMRPAEIVEHYADLTDILFPQSRRARWRLFPHVRSPTHSGDIMRKALSAVLGSRSLGESTKRLIIPTWNVQRGQVHIFKTPHHPRLRRDGGVSMVDVAMATTAAPTLFPAAGWGGQRLVDGGVWASNPSVVAIGEAVSMLGIPLEAIRVLNLGVVDQRTKHPVHLDIDRGALARSTAQFLITASNRGAQGSAMHLVGKHNFTRFEAEVPDDAFIPAPTRQALLAQLAGIQSHVLSAVYTDKFANHITIPYTPSSS
ncbi:patatin [Spongiactinospora rosea]|uniref:Patatin n=2 Tax=Spongiactinospora rosea TaxID=2248750 RepID=A0A366M4W1_9ACTN|nr:patatin [Spongiactinospora rosea]